MHRRLFLQSVAGAVIAVDPEKLLWKPGRMISIPPAIHIPKLQVFVVTGQLFGDAPPDPDPWFFESVEAGIKKRIDREIELAGGRRPVFVQLPTVKGVSYAPLGALPVRRTIVYDPASRAKWVARTECAVRL